MLVVCSPSCLYWCCARWVCFSPTACQQAPGTGSLWDQGLAAVESYESQWLKLCCLHLCLACEGDGGCSWIHMLWHTSAQPQTCKSSFVSPQSFYQEKGCKTIMSGIFCYVIYNYLFIYTSIIPFALESLPFSNLIENFLYLN